MFTIIVFKRCPKCGETKPATHEFWRRHSRRNDLCQPWCRLCLLDNWRTNGRRKTERRHGPALTRFWAKVNKDGPVPSHRPELGPCWLWTARRSGKGYGWFWLPPKLVQAHRFAFFLAYGRWPEPCALHHCDNPSCVRDDHLFEGTDADNAADRDEKGRRAPPAGEANGRAKLSRSDVISIRAARAAGESQRSIARRYGVNKSTIGQIDRGTHWKL